MGNAASRARLALLEALALVKIYSDLYKRIQASPGLPVPNPTLSFWTVPSAPIASYRCERLPDHADVVIVGSGITGVSIARVLLEHPSERPLKIVMLEARDVCSGATGRNGGHINPPVYHDYGIMKKRYGEAMAKKVIRFRLAHREDMKRITAEEGIDEAQTRDVDCFDVYYEQEEFEEACKKLVEWKADMPDEARDFHSCEGEEAVERFAVSGRARGVVYGRAGAMHPYRFVTALLSRFLKRYPDNFFLSARTPCTNITEPSRSSPLYTVTTSRGELTAAHVVHATNGWSGHLLKPMRTKLFPIRGCMTAQRPGTGLSPSPTSALVAPPPYAPALAGSPEEDGEGYTLPVPGERSFVFYNNTLGFDYLTQLSRSADSDLSPTATHGELMLGGGYVRGGGGGLNEIGLADDSTHDTLIGTHLSGALPVYFGEENWGREESPCDRDLAAVSEEDKARRHKWFEGRVKAIWSGVLAISADRQPWVGRLPTKIAGRKAPSEAYTPVAKGKTAITAAPGEWLAGGYSGEGMVHAFKSGEALGYMILGDRAVDEVELSAWFPEIFSITHKRWKAASALALLDTWIQEE